MLQLVQAYRYEYFEQSELKKFLLQKVVSNIKIATMFHWLVFLEKENRQTNSPEINKRYTELYNEFVELINTQHSDIADSLDLQKAFRSDTLKTALKIRHSKEKNEG